MDTLRRVTTEHRRAVGVTLAVGIALAVAGLLWFQPWKLFTDVTAAETLPTAPPTAQPSPGGSATARTLARGEFRSYEHGTTGSARIVRLADGRTVLRIEDLDTSNGPDLRVYLSTLPAGREGRSYGDGAIDLGALRGNKDSDLTYDLPRGEDPARFRSVVIWCRRFTVAFGVAPLG